MTWLDFILFAFCFALIAIIYTEVLTAPGMILGWWDKILHDLMTKEWILKPLGDCVYCFGGQLALWGYLLVADYDWLQHVLFVGFTIGVIHIYQKIWN